eukprot:TRINITY_DN7952_c0_g1_i2.p2 TRINITY_DN7952_c0_g1~~TRINITY_DN7952_c0_g1_i2.p2  ORF type:complete len:110 (+),score=23.76 TRINITY_DN7952_c0_g1_i2:101-430(+)
MRLITSIEYPFGYELDDLDAEWLLLATERETYSYFTEAMPSNDSDVIRVQPAPSREGPKGFAAGSAVEEVALGVMNGVCVEHVSQGPKKPATTTVSVKPAAGPSKPRML